MTTALASLLLVACSTVPVESIPVSYTEPPAESAPDVQRNTEAAEPYYVPLPPVGDRCPPLPLLKDGMNRVETRIWTLTIIGLYAQCASSKP